MSTPGAETARRAASTVRRLGRAWGRLGPEQRLAAAASLSLFVTLFLPWYRVTAVTTATSPHAAFRGLPTQIFSGWGAFSFVEAAVLLVALSVLVLLFQRAEGRAFHLPGGDGSVVVAAGVWTCFLVIWRMFDKPGVTSQGQVDLSSGIEWGIFVALGAAGFLTYAGTRIRAAHRPEPPLPTEGGAVFDGHWHEGVRITRSERTQRPAGRVAARAPTQRSSWRPAERPEWSESERPVGWLTAPPKPRRPSADRHPDTPGPPSDPVSEQLTIPFEADDRS